MTDSKPGIYVVFDGPPAPKSGRFIETENEKGEGIGPRGVKWTQREDGYWVLGPFTTTARHEVDRDGYVRDRALSLMARRLAPDLDRASERNRAEVFTDVGTALDALLDAGYTVLAPPSG